MKLDTRSFTYIVNLLNWYRDLFDPVISIYLFVSIIL